MNRQEKKDLLMRLSGMYESSQFVFIVLVNAVKAGDTMSFRREMRKANSPCVIAKNTLNSIAAKAAGLESLTPHFIRQTLTIFTNDPIEVAKILERYDDKGYSVVAGSDKKVIYSAGDVKKLAKVPSKQVLQGMLLSSILGVHRKTVRTVLELPSSVARLIATRTKTN